MKKITYFNGGHRVKNDDLKHVQDGLIEATENLAQGLGLDGQPASTPLILTGANGIGSVPGTITWTSGWLQFGGELYFVQAQPTPVSTPDFDLYVDTTYLSGNPVNHKDGTPRNVHKINILVGKDSVIEGAPGLFNSSLLLTASFRYRVEKSLTDKLIASGDFLQELNNSAWSAAGVTITSGYTENFPLEYRVAGDFIELRGELFNASTTNITVATLPGGVHPVTNAKTFAFAVGRSSGGSSIETTLRLNSTGEVVVAAEAAASNDLICFDNIKFRRL